MPRKRGQPDPYIDAFQKRLKLAREAVGMTQAEMAQALGFKSGDAYAKYENRQNNLLAPHYYAQFSRLTGVSLEWLINASVDHREFQAPTGKTDSHSKHRY